MINFNELPMTQKPKAEQTQLNALDEQLASLSQSIAGIRNTDKIKSSEVPELVGQIIDIFEDFLAAKEVNIYNPEKVFATEDGVDVSEIAILYGSDYAELETYIKSTLASWGIIGSDL